MTDPDSRLALFPAADGATSRVTDPGDAVVMINSDLGLGGSAPDRGGGTLTAVEHPAAAQSRDLQICRGGAGVPRP